MLTIYQAICSCGYRGPETQDKTRAEVTADTHEVRNARRAYAHETKVAEFEYVGH